MTDAEKVKDVYDQLYATYLHIKVLESNMRELAQNHYLPLTCPFKVGDIVTCCGYTHEGKQMRIDRMGCRLPYQGWAWYVQGPILNKKGEPSKFTGEFDKYQYEQYMGKGKVSMRTAPFTAAILGITNSNDTGIS